MIPGVPYDAEIEYLESTGTQYIDTGVVADANTVANLMACNTRNDSISWIFGARKSWCEKAFAIYNGSDQGYKYTVSYGNFGTPQYLVSNISSTTGVLIQITLGIITRIDTWQNNYGSQLFQTPGNCILFGALLNTTISLGWCKVAKCQIYQGTTLVRDFIPVRVGQTGYMYDRVTKRLFGNQGTGSFVLGPDVAKPVIGLYGMRKRRFEASDYVQDGLVAMWDGIENDGWGVHNRNATVWKDLVGKYDLTLNGGSWDDNPGWITVQNKKGFCNSRPSKPLQMEACFVANSKTTTWQAYSTIVRMTYANSKPNPCMRIDMTSNKIVFSSWGAIYTLNPFGNNKNMPMSISTRCDWTAATTTTGIGNWAAWVNGTQSQVFFENGSQADGSSMIEVNGHSNNENGFVGRMYCIRFYFRALSADEIAHNYAIDKARFNLP